MQGVVRVGITGTVVCNGPRDMPGFCRSINADERLKRVETWSLDRKCAKINPATVAYFQEHSDRVREDMLNLPPMTRRTFDFDPQLSPEEMRQYNGYLSEARSCRATLTSDPSDTDVNTRLTQLLQKMQQALVSPLLAQRGARAFKESPDLFRVASLRDTGSLQALHHRLKVLKAAGHRRIMVAVCHVALMRIAKLYLQRVDRGEGRLGKFFSYDGEYSLSARQKQKTEFLGADDSVLFLSIKAGGTGLHLVPGCCAAVFWGSSAFSPAVEYQATKRIHRIGQEFPVEIHHMIAHGSVDYAIHQMHADKAGLASAITDGDWSHFEDNDQLRWRHNRRIVDACVSMADGGDFEREAPLREPLGQEVQPLSPKRKAPDHGAEPTKKRRGGPVGNGRKRSREVCAPPMVFKKAAIDRTTTADSLMAHSSGLPPL
ncbi:MAG: hypothetical protein CMI16_12780 [Opitutaceae bacterium]|nr:hypothetical protein [Opitutaceae bacterium]